MQRRSDTGSWAVPGGALDPDEQPAQASVLRSTRTPGWSCDPFRWWGSRRTVAAYPNGDVVQAIATVFACDIVGGELGSRDGESLELAFFDRGPAGRGPGRPVPAETFDSEPRSAAFRWDDSWLPVWRRAPGGLVSWTGRLRRCGPSIVERADDGAEQVGERDLVVEIAVAQQPALLLEESVEGGVDPSRPSSVRRTSTPRRSPGSGSRSTRPLRLEPVDPVGHRPGGDHRLRDQPTGGELVRRPGPAQRGQHVELPGLEVVRREGLTPGEVEVPGQPGDPAEDLQRRDVEVGPLALPGRDQAVDLVPACGSARTMPSRLLTSRHIAR